MLSLGDGIAIATVGEATYSMGNNSPKEIYKCLT